MNIGIYIYDKVSVGIFRDCNVFTSNRYWGAGNWPSKQRAKCNIRGITKTYHRSIDEI